MQLERELDDGNMTAGCKLHQPMRRSHYDASVHDNGIVLARVRPGIRPPDSRSTRRSPNESRMRVSNERLSTGSVVI